MQSIDRLLYSIIIADENEEVEGGGGGELGWELENLEKLGEQY